jgi:hypothetical protein
LKGFPSRMRDFGATKWAFLSRMRDVAALGWATIGGGWRLGIGFRIFQRLNSV